MPRYCFCPEYELFTLIIVLSLLHLGLIPQIKIERLFCLLCQLFWLNLYLLPTSFIFFHNLLVERLLYMLRNILCMKSLLQMILFLLLFLHYHFLQFDLTNRWRFRMLAHPERIRSGNFVLIITWLALWTRLNWIQKIFLPQILSWYIECLWSIMRNTSFIL